MKYAIVNVGCRFESRDMEEIEMVTSTDYGHPRYLKKCADVADKICFGRT